MEFDFWEVLPFSCIAAITGAEIRSHSLQGQDKVVGLRAVFALMFAGFQNASLGGGFFSPIADGYFLIVKVVVLDTIRAEVGISKFQERGLSIG